MYPIRCTGPAIMSIILLKNYSAAVPGLLSFRNQFLSIPLTLFTLFSLFILPKGLLVRPFASRF